MIVRQSGRFGEFRRLGRRAHDRFNRDGSRAGWSGRCGVLLHQPCEEILVERSPVDANTYRLAVINRHLHDRLEILIAMLAPHIAWIDSVLREERCCLRMRSEELMTVVVEVTHDRGRKAIICQPLHDLRDRCCSCVIVDGDAH